MKHFAVFETEQDLSGFMNDFADIIVRKTVAVLKARDTEISRTEMLSRITRAQYEQWVANGELKVSKMGKSNHSRVFANRDHFESLLRQKMKIDSEVHKENILKARKRKRA